MILFIIAIYFIIGISVGYSQCQLLHGFDEETGPEDYALVMALCIFFWPLILTIYAFMLLLKK